MNELIIIGVHIFSSSGHVASVTQSLLAYKRLDEMVSIPVNQAWSHDGN
jgi:hypothetical protein